MDSDAELDFIEVTHQMSRFSFGQPSRTARTERDLEGLYFKHVAEMPDINLTASADEATPALRIISDDSSAGDIVLELNIDVVGDNDQLRNIAVAIADIVKRSGDLMKLRLVSTSGNKSAMLSAAGNSPESLSRVLLMGDEFDGSFVQRHNLQQQ